MTENKDSKGKIEKRLIEVENGLRSLGLHCCFKCGNWSQSASHNKEAQLICDKCGDLI